MEQHNIDSRFKKGLENLNRQPTPDAWARLQNQLNTPVAAPEPEITKAEEKEERRILVWWHYAAAAVVLLFVSFGILKNGSFLGEKTQMPMAVNQPKEISEPVEKAAEVTLPISENVAVKENLIAATETPDSEISPEIKPENAMKNGSKTEVKTAFSQAPEKQLAQNTAKSKTSETVAKSPEKLISGTDKPEKTEEKLLAANQTNTEIKTETSETKPALLAGMAIEVIVKKDNSENALALVEPAPEEDKDSKLKSIFKQAKNLKNGESVDLQALGVNSDSKLAMGTRTISQKFSKVLDI